VRTGPTTSEPTSLGRALLPYEVGPGFTLLRLDQSDPFAPEPKKATLPEGQPSPTSLFSLGRLDP